MYNKFFCHSLVGHFYSAVFDGGAGDYNIFADLGRTQVSSVDVGSVSTPQLGKGRSIDTAFCVSGEKK